VSNSFDTIIVGGGLVGAALRARIPQVFEAVLGASYSRHDGHLNPLLLLHALHKRMQDLGCHYFSDRHVASVDHQQGIFDIDAGDERYRAGQAVLCAGLDNQRLARDLGMRIPVAPLRGQLLITERVANFLPCATLQVRQTMEGTLQIGDSHEDVGFDDSTTLDVITRLAARAVRIFPHLSGVRLMASIRHARLACYKAVSELRAAGGERLQSISFTAGGKRHEIEAGLLLLHQGVIPNLNIDQAAACAIDWNEAQLCWQPQTDGWGESSQPGIFVAGDGAGIVGARAASLNGQLAGLQVAHRLGLLDTVARDRLAKPLRNAADRHFAIRPFLDAAYRVADAFLAPADDTVVCRCEEIEARDIRAMVKLGCTGPNQAKVFSRCGMGPCQGRFCAGTVEQIFARERGLAVGDIGRFNARPPFTSITLGQLAETRELEEEQHDRETV